MRQQEKRLTLRNGLIDKAVGINSGKTGLPGKGRPGRIPGQIEGHTPRLAESSLIAVKGGYALGGQHHAAKAEQKHERQIQPAQAAFGFFLTQAVFRNFFRAHDVLLGRPSGGAGLGRLARRKYFIVIVLLTYPQK